MGFKTISTNKYSSARLNSTNLIPTSVLLQKPPTVEYLVVAGGGGGGATESIYGSGGGGAGGYLTGTTDLINTIAGRTYADSTYTASGWITGTNYIGSTGAFVYSFGNIQGASGGARTVSLPEVDTYFEILISTSPNLTLVGLCRDTSAGGYNNVPSISLYQGTAFGGLSGGTSLGAFVAGDVFRIAYKAATNKVYFGKNGTWYADPISTAGATIPGTGNLRFIIMSGASLGSNTSGTFRVNTQNTYSAPSGYTTMAASFGVTIPISINIIVGAGGARNIAGVSSVFGTIGTVGGGKGNGGAGGSGGGGGGAVTGGLGTVGQGKNGGVGIVSSSAGKGGGGGASAVGGSSNGNFGGAGGAGLSNSITGTSTYYAGGGGGGCRSSIFASGGVGGGAAGGGTGKVNGSDGTANTGGGGGGGSSGDGGGGGAGGSGVVIIRYPTIYAPPKNIIGSPTITIDGSYRVYTFTSSGSITFTDDTVAPTWPLIYNAIGAFSTNLAAYSAYSALTYSVYSGTLPAGLALSTTGTISGTVTASAGTYTCVVAATDSVSQYGIQPLRFTVSVVSTPPAVEYLVVAGGGGGGGQYGGGGGAGGYLTATAYSVTAGTPITITVGAGGAGGPTQSNGVTGENSIFGTITATGGGGGGQYAGLSGGSGGGGGVPSSGTTLGGSAAPSGQGNLGGNGGRLATGGGGGAGGAGVAQVGNTGGTGGVGLSSSISGTATYYAGGGGGMGWDTLGVGGNGGGGNGTLLSGTPTAGTTNTGGGGGGSVSAGGAGGSGIVIIRYADTSSAAASTTGSPTITVAGGYRIYKWTSSGSITF